MKIQSIISVLMFTCFAQAQGSLTSRLAAAQNKISQIRKDIKTGKIGMQPKCTRCYRQCRPCVRNCSR